MALGSRIVEDIVYVCCACLRLTPSLIHEAIIGREGIHARVAHRPMADPQVAMESAMRGSNLARPPGMNALAGRLRTMNGAWLDDHRGYCVCLLRADTPDAEPHYEGQEITSAIVGAVLNRMTSSTRSDQDPRKDHDLRSHPPYADTMA